MRGLLGSGAMGVTHRAYDMVLDREVAIKELLPGLALDEELVNRFRNEARVLAGLSHPCIVQVYDFLEEAGHMWIVMELLRGSELADLIREKGMITVTEVTRIGLQMAEAMGYAHARGVVHRDFKPSNVMLTPGGSTKITDFGLARLTRTSVYTEEGIVLGTPYYMSPEQAEGRAADQRSDIYSMGVVLYQMLTGRVPFEGEHMASILEKHIHEEPTPPSRIASGIPQELESLLLTMLSKDPEKRLQDMKAIAEVLGKYT
jgi:eukaryotic-like serine/threonine-protein kinase